MFGLIFALYFFVCHISLACGGTNVSNSCQRPFCEYSLEWTVDGDEVVFHLSGAAQGWVAVGFSEDRRMGGVNIDDVIACVRMPSDEIVVIDGFNLPLPSLYASIWDWDGSGVQMISSGYDGITIECTFKRTLKSTDKGGDLPLTLPLYQFYGMSSNPIKTNGTFSKHTKVPWISDRPVHVVREKSGSFSVPLKKEEIGVPEGCISNRSLCTFYMLEAVVDGHVMLELEGSTSGWIAVGYSYDQVMGGDNIDDVIGCLVTGAEETVVAKDTVNLQNLLSNIDDTIQDDIKLLDWTYQNGCLHCRLIRTAAGSSPSEDIDIANPLLYRFLGTGPPEEFGNSKFGFHGSNNIPHVIAPNYVATRELVSTGICTVGPLLRVHGILMYLSWGVLGVVAIFMARHMHPALPNHQWLYVHQILLLLSLFASVVGFILVFIHFFMTGTTKGLINFGVNNPIGSAHFVLGSMVVVLQIVNPIMAFFRPPEASQWRRVFHLIHGYLIGTALQLLAAVVIFLGLYRYGETSGTTHYPPFYVWTVVVLGVMVTEVSLKVYTLMAPRFGRSEYVTPIAKKPRFKDPTTNGIENKRDVTKKTERAKLTHLPSKDHKLRWVVFALLSLLVVLAGVAITALLGIACL